MPHPTRPNLQHYLDAHPHDLPRAVDEYRAALHAWSYEAEQASVTRKAPPTFVPLAVVLCAAVVVAWLMLRALAGCSSTDPAPGDCAAACHAGEDEGSRALLDCVAACSSLDADPTHNGDPRP